MNPSILEADTLFHAWRRSGDRHDSALVLRPPLPDDMRREKVARLLTGSRGVGSRGPQATKGLVRAYQMNPGPLHINIQTMLAKTLSMNPATVPKEALRSFWFARAVRVTDGDQNMQKVETLEMQRIAAADWVTRVIERQPVDLYIAASNEGEHTDTIRHCGARLLGFMHTHYDSTMFYEPFIEASNGEKGLLPFGFRACRDLFVGVEQPLGSDEGRASS